MNTYTGEIARFDSEEQYQKATNGCAQVWKPIDLANLTIATRKLLEETGRAQISRNSPCPCGSRKRFKRCCMQVAEKAAADVLLDASAADNPFPS